MSASLKHESITSIAQGRAVTREILTLEECCNLRANARYYNERDDVADFTYGEGVDQRGRSFLLIVGMLTGAGLVTTFHLTRAESDYPSVPAV
jgi:hypothetical protein